jgi:hypothetical protein
LARRTAYCSFKKFLVAKYFSRREDFLATRK